MAKDWHAHGLGRSRLVVVPNLVSVVTAPQHVVQGAQILKRDSYIQMEKPKGVVG